MKKQIHPSIKAHLLRSALYLLLLVAVCAIPFALAQSRSRGTAKQSVAQRSSVHERVGAPGLPRTSLTPQRTSGVLGAHFVVAPPAPNAPQVILYDQYNNAGTFATLSATFTDSPPNNCDLADDFVVPGGQTWNVQSIDADGLYFNGSGPANSFNVFFYANSGSFPGTQVYSTNNQPFTQNGTTFTVNLPTPAVLTAGTYWVEIQANMTFSMGGEWGWTARTVTSNNVSAWQNPAGGFAPPSSCPAPGCPTPCPTCISWGIRQCCTGNPAGAPDQVFRLNGTLGVPSPTPTPTLTATPTPVATPTARPRPSFPTRPTPPPRP
jgi:hypothetical protein